ncbi:hypothetical protein JCM19047_190 [Bacillus sp. JCM 19047]|nr:hypothetical protein JCM19047_190 [Bacillus sp. JCM 19047]
MGCRSFFNMLFPIMRHSFGLIATAVKDQVWEVLILFINKICYNARRAPYKDTLRWNELIDQCYF